MNHLNLGFDKVWRGIKIRGFNQIKKFLRQITPRNKPYYHSEKKCLGLGALINLQMKVFPVSLPR